MTVLPVNDAPVAIAATASTNEDQSTVVQLSGDDIDGDNLTFELDQSPTYGSVSIEGSFATYIPDDNANGIDTFTFYANDGLLLSAESAEVTITINPINDAPILSDVSDLSFDESGSTTLDLSASDVDEDDLTFSISGGVNITASLENSTVNFGVLDDDWNGTESFTVTVDDGELSDSRSFSVTVLPVNDAPILTFIEDQNVNEGESLIILLTASDIDGDDLAFEAASSENIVTEITGTALTISPMGDFYGIEVITITVLDGFGGSDSQNINISVQPVNDSPVLGFINNPSFNEDESFDLILQVEDVDGDELSFSLVGGNQISGVINTIVNEDGEQYIVTFNSQENYFGTEIFTIIVSDPDGLSDSQTIIVEVLPVNDAPVANGAIASTNEDQNTIVVLSATDIDSNTLIYSFEEGLSATNTQLGSAEITGAFLNYIPNSDEFGEDSFIFIVADNDGLSDTSNVTITINPINDPPVIFDIPIQESNEDVVFAYTINANDVDGDEIFYEPVQSQNALIWIETSEIEDGETGEIEFVSNINISPNQDWYGMLNVQFSASDGLLTVFKDFIVNILPVNDPPVANPMSIFLDEEESRYFDLDGQDIDDFNLLYNITDYPSNGSIDIDNLPFITYIPDTDYFGNDTLYYSVTDTSLETSTALVSFSISNIDDIPELPLIPDSYINEDSIFVLELPYKDVDEEILEYNININGLENVSYSIDNINELDNIRYLSIIPNEDWNGTLIIDVTASDLLSSVNEEFVLDVIPVNDSPQIVSSPILTALINEQYEYQVEIYDPDSETFYFDLSNYPEGMDISEDGFITWTPTETGLYPDIQIIVYDSEVFELADYDSQIFSIDIKLQQLFSLHEGSNLISFVGLNIDEQDNLIESIFTDITPNLTHIFTENYASIYLEDDNIWFGSLDFIEPERGYWLRVENPDSLELITYESPSDLIYNLHYGNNLISYIGDNNASIEDAIPDEVEDYFTNIFTENLSATKIDGVWVGTLAIQGLEHLKGYWMNVSQDLSFSYNSSGELMRSYNNNVISDYSIQSIPIDFRYNQSQLQSFYYIKNIKLLDTVINDNDWILAYHNDVIVGARKWAGEYTDIPAMGNDGFDETSDYCINNSEISFKLYKSETLEFIDLVGEIPQWKNLNNFIVYELHEENNFPEEFHIDDPYPNPFNPVVNLDFEVPNNSLIEISIYDIRGRLVEKLVDNSFYVRGYHTIKWNASSYSSGIYLVKFVGGSQTDIKKITLVK